MDDTLSHLDAEGRPRMVDVGPKPETARLAVAAVSVRFSQGILGRVLRGELPKGAVLDTARIAGIQAAKRTSELIPLCHPVRLTEVKIRFRDAGDDRLGIEAEARALDRTGVEMEAMTAAAVAALTVYDMVKAVDRGMVVEDLRLVRKEGGKGGPWERTA